MLHFPLPINSPGCILMALEANPFHLQLGVLEQGGSWMHRPQGRGIGRRRTQTTTNPSNSK